MTDRIPLETGSLTPDQVALVLARLPLDLTFVDENNIVQYYSEAYRIFKRTPEDIGSDVVACHSPGTRPRVAQLISELAGGWRDSAEFLEEAQGRPVRVAYIACRDSDGAYRGVLEIVQWADEET